MIQQSANPNATNSELDAKKIVKNVELTSLQRNEIAEQFAELVVDNMETKDLVRYVYSNMMEHFVSLTADELEEEIYNYDEELFEELVDNVTQQYPKQLNTFEKETFIDINNTGGKF